MQGSPADDWVPLRRPQFELRESRLYFLLSTRPHAEFDANDVALWRSVDGVSTVGDLKLVQAEAPVRLERFWSLGVCEFAPSHFPEGRRRILVIEPHMDDAILSVGGLMWSLRDTCDFTLATVGGRSNFTSYYVMEREFFNVQRISELRRAESSLAMRLLGGRHVDMQQAEAPLRYREGDWSLDWFKRHRRAIGGFIGHCADAGEIDAWTAAIAQIVGDTEAEEIWMPLGVGDHADHELTRNACLRALSQQPNILNRCKVFLYQDVPYASRFPKHTEQIVQAISEAGGTLEQELVCIDEAFEAKLRLLSIFGSQFKMSYMTPMVDGAARAAGSGGEGRYECRYEITRVPTFVDPIRMYSGRKYVEELSEKVEPWYRQHRLSRRIRIFCPIPIGRWANDLSILLSAFPNAVLEVHVSDKNLEETTALVSPRIDVRQVRGSSMAAWGWQIARIALSRPSPMFLLLGEGREPFERLISAICFMSDTFVGPRMTHVVLALQKIASTSTLVGKSAAGHL